MEKLYTIVFACMICLIGAGCVPSSSGKQAVDIDLSAFSVTMAHSTVVDMLTNPEKHLGKTVRAQGWYTVLYYTPERPYNFIIIDGATGCCSQELMFIHTDSDYEYPQQGTRVEITGMFSSYNGFDFPYNYLAIDDITIVK